ncbi:Hyoscyamine 6-dioxygenase [Canna indica]|uniref:Hyoscyamine 6-dioxygenase n=1 Tax=Canna indica TaxID=4628 RepID=A0AAQ3KC82_9LILI|nr:Hyoscyamine 6-dioxygenase [Canna indica]
MAFTLVNVEPLSVPVLDFSRLNCSTSRPLAVQDIGRACKKMGCVQVVNHGIQGSIISSALEAATDFFELPSEVKAGLASEDVRKPVRFSEGFMHNNNNKRAFLKLYAHPLSHCIQFWPLTPVHYRERMGNYAIEVRRVALQLMDAILESLGLGKAYMGEKLDEGSDLTVGLAPHTDYEFIAILIQSCDGLQILKDIDGNGKSWKKVPAGFPDSLHVHIGDHLEVLSNGRYKSLVHRTVINSHDRISIASIHGLSMDEKVATPRELVDEQ